GRTGAPAAGASSSAPGADAAVEPAARSHASSRPSRAGTARVAPPRPERRADRDRSAWQRWAGERG
ncbi:hypothetical protein ACWD8I_30035, partial [Micromonospora arida]